jgi:protein phosphatase
MTFGNDPIPDGSSSLLQPVGRRPAAEEVPKAGPRSAWEEEAPNQAALADLEPPRRATPDEPPLCLNQAGWLQAAAATNPGKVRSGNEDRFLLETWGDTSPAVVAAVFDGMGGHGGGDLAAQIACHTVLDNLHRHPYPDGDAARYKVLLRALDEADRAIRWRGSRELGRGGMGTTAAVAMLTPDGGLHLYCGDSRLYHYRDGQVLYRTKDHSIIQVLLDCGKIKPEEVATHSMRSQLTTCLGGGGEPGHAVVEPVWSSQDTGQPARLDLQPGDVVLLCSDGLCGEIPTEDLDMLVAEHGKDPSVLVERCIQAALDAGGRDNVTVIALRWGKE